MNPPLTGNLLVASSLVTDPVLAKAVCLVVRHDDSKFWAVILNCPMQPGIEAFMAMLGGTGENDADERDRDSEPASRFASIDADDHQLDEPSGQQVGQLHFGGPMSGPVVALHQSVQYAEAEPGDGIYVAAQRQHLESLVRDHDLPFRLFVGHVGWETEQFQAEFESGLWHIVPATADTVFAAPSDMWPELIHRATSSSMARWLGIEDIEDAEELN